MAEQNCPEKQLLRQFAAGRGEPAQRQAIEGHVARCPRCQNTVASAAAATPNSPQITVDLAADAHAQSGSYLICEHIDVDSDQANSQSDAAQEELNSRFDFRLLQPAQEPGAIGQLGKYVVLDVLGYGGMGIVFRAKDEQLLRSVAIKVMSRDLASSPTARRRFIREARAAAAINHPNVVTIYAVEEHDGTPFLVMELIGGESLRDRLRRPPKLQIGDVVSIAYQIASGLAAAHAQGVIHRDIKPGNVMLEDQLQRVKITDFGLARVAVDNVELTSNHIGIGTPSYMSPEQVKGEEVGPRSDLFALGCVMYAMIFGHSPFHGRTALEVVRNVADREPSPAATHAGVPAFLAEIIERLLHKSPDKRYQSADEVAELLRRDLEEINRTPTNKLGQLLLAPRPARSKRRVLPFVVAGAVVLALFAGLAEWKLRLFSSPAVQPSTDFASSAPGTAAGGTDALGTVTGAAGDSSPPATELRPLVTVAKDGNADCATIGEALRQVAPGGQVTVLDAAVYEETLRLADSQRHAGVRLIASQQATIKSGDYGTLIAIRGIPNLRLEGIKIVATQVQVGLEITGSCPGLHVENVTIERIANPDGTSTSNAAVALRDGAAGSAEEPIVVRRLKLLSTNVGVAIVTSDTQGAPPRHIILEDSLIVGLSRENSTLLALLRRSEDVTIRRNIFSRGMQGLSLLVTDDAVPIRCQIEHNTWHDIRSWMTWSGPSPAPLLMQIHRNLIVDAQGCSPVVRGLTSAAKEAPLFSGNLLVNSNETGAQDFAPAAADMPDFPFVSLDENHVNYLKPDFARLQAARSALQPIPGRYSNDAAP